ncbi:hypothetical protein RclHR1_09110010 [Rhizophagus clarus]|uniref:Uncharacterized protein n=1 Tax=Rhizophagus clarus TaxID=94130 RepID=A0A2Z6S9G4_9GLOM|nr:hypothetical protein RclHR1_09110010 [Rhizophagus clarus]GES88155.1 hypothetical protein RCL_jg25568.t1 [Rhizophagus clarus]
MPDVANDKRSEFKIALVADTDTNEEKNEFRIVIFKEKKEEPNNKNDKKDINNIQRARFEIMSLAEQYILYKKNKKFSIHLFAASILVLIFAEAMGQLLRTAEKTGTAGHIGGIFSGIVGTGSLIGAFLTFGTNIYNKKKEEQLDCTPKVNDKDLKPMFIPISNDILKEMDDFKVTIYDMMYSICEEILINRKKERVIAYYAKYLKRKNDSLSLENYVGLAFIVISFLYILLVPVLLTLVYMSDFKDFFDHQTDRSLRNSIMLVGEVLAGFVIFYRTFDLFDYSPYSWRHFRFPPKRRCGLDRYVVMFLLFHLIIYICLFIPILIMYFITLITGTKKITLLTDDADDTDDTGDDGVNPSSDGIFICCWPFRSRTVENNNMNGEEKCCVCTKYYNFHCFKILSLSLPAKDEHIIRNILNGNLEGLKEEMPSRNDIEGLQGSNSTRKILERLKEVVPSEENNNINGSNDSEKEMMPTEKMNV